MGSTFLGLEIARRALMAHRRAMDVAAHNIANAYNPAYSRQRAELVATPPMTPGGMAGQIGTGAWVASIQRLRDQFLDERLRHEQTLLGNWQVQRDVLEQVERLVAEPSDQGLQAVFDQFWQALQDLSLQPDSLAARELVVRRGEVLASTVQRLFRQLDQLRRDLDRTVELKVQQVNQMAEQLARLNGQIARVVASGQRPNDLLDERDRLLDQLSRLLAVQVSVRPTGDAGGEGTVAVYVGGLELVDGEHFHRLVLEGQPPEREIRWDGPGGPVVKVQGGELAAYLELRGGASSPDAAWGVLPELMRDLDRWARAFGTAFNALHRTGYALGASSQVQLPFFRTQDPALDVPIDDDQDGWVADDLAVLPAVRDDPRLVAAASQPDSPGDGSHAAALAALRFEPLDALGGATATDFWAALVGRLGVRTQQAQTQADNQELVVHQLQTLRESISGVSLDEEMADLVRFEQAYAAAARALTALDEALAILIERTGLVGR